MLGVGEVGIVQGFVIFQRQAGTVEVAFVGRLREPPSGKGPAVRSEPVMGRPSRKNRTSVGWRRMVFMVRFSVGQVSDLTVQAFSEGQFPGVLGQGEDPRSRRLLEPAGRRSAPRARCSRASLGGGYRGGR